MHTLTVAELSAGLRARKFSSLDLTLHLLGRIERLGPELNAFVTITAERALADARAADAKLLKETAAEFGVPVSMLYQPSNNPADIDQTLGEEPTASAEPTFTPFPDEQSNA